MAEHNTYDEWLIARHRADKLRRTIDRCEHRFHESNGMMASVPNMVYSPMDGFEIQQGSLWAMVKTRTCSLCGLRQTSRQTNPDAKLCWEERS